MIMNMKGECNFPMMLSSGSIKNLMAVFESKRTAFESASSDADKKKRSVRQRSGKLREKIEIFEHGQDSISSLKLKSEKSFRLQKELSLVDLMSRKSSLMESFRRQPSHTQLTVSPLSKSLHDSLADLDSTLLVDFTPVPIRRGGRRPKTMRRASTGFLGVGTSHRKDLLEGNLTEISQDECPAGSSERSRLERRASTGRLLFSEKPHVIWEFTDTYATPILSLPQDFQDPCHFHGKVPMALPTRKSSQDLNDISVTAPKSSQDSCHHSVNDDEEMPSAPRPRRGLLRRHSTGCLSSDSNDENVASTDTFWQVYEQADSFPPEQPLPSVYSRRHHRRRMVRFDQHVTVWVFSKDTRCMPEDLPQFFKRRVSGFDRAPRAPRRSKRSSGEDRFSSSGGKGNNILCPPSMPIRRSNSAYTTEPGKEDDTQEFSHRSSSLVTQTADVTPPRLPCRRPSTQSPPTRPERNLSAHSQISLSNLTSPSFHDCVGPKDTTSWHSTLTFDFNDFDRDDSAPSNDDSDDDDSVLSEESSISEDDSPSGATRDDDVLDRRHLFQLLASQKKRESSCQEQTPLQQRRERAIMWHCRFAMPTYKMMKYQVQNTPGLGITLEDVDWLFENARR